MRFFVDCRSLVFWGCSKLSTIYYYGTTEPEYSTGSCYNTNIECGTSSTVSCAPFTCSCPLQTVYVPTGYQNSTDSFCGKSVIVSPTLEIE